MEVRVWSMDPAGPASLPRALGTSDQLVCCAEGQAGPGHSGTLFAETKFLCLCFSIIILAGGIFPRGSGGRGSAMAVSPPALSVSSHAQALLCPPACRNDFLIMQPVLGIANPPPAQHPLLQFAPQPLTAVPRVVVPSPEPITNARDHHHSGREGRPGRATGVLLWL